MTSLENSTLSDWLRHHAEVRPEAIALSSREGDVTYRELAADVARLVSGLASIGIGRGDTIAVQLPNSRAFVTTLLAAAGRGAIFQTLHMPYRRHELSYLLTDSAAAAVVVFGPEKTAAALELAEGIDSLQTVVSVGAEMDGAVSWVSLTGVEAKPGDQVATTADDPFLLLYTSGTTAEPKGVPHTSGGFLNNALWSAEDLEIREGSRVMSLAAMSHLYGLFTLQLALASGGTTVLLPAFDPQTLLDDLTVLRPHAVFAAPAHFAPFVGAGRINAGHLSGIRILCLSGAAVPPTLATALDAMMDDGAVIQLWGMSELQAGSFGRPGDPLQKRTTTAGRVTRHTRLRVRGEEDGILEAGAEGALEVRGPSVFGGYLNKPAETRAAFTDDGWFRTGDLAVIDEDGYLALTGRTKELINRGGVKYNPVEVEIEVMKLSQVVQCAVVPVADDVLGERGCLCVEILPEKSLSLDEVADVLAAAGLAKYKWPERIEILEEMPMTPTRKVMRGRLAGMITDRKD